MTARRPGALRRIATRMAVGALAGALASTALVAVSAPAPPPRPRAPRTPPSRSPDAASSLP
ncbi:hypothetical protein ACFQZC_18710 [Streptacidiphilus monticola]